MSKTAGQEHDPEVAEDYAESVGVDPTPEEIQRYAELAGADPLEAGTDRDALRDRGA